MDPITSVTIIEVAKIVSGTLAVVVVGGWLARGNTRLQSRETAKLRSKELIYESSREYSRLAFEHNKEIVGALIEFLNEVQTPNKPDLKNWADQLSTARSWILEGLPSARDLDEQRLNGVRTGGEIASLIQISHELAKPITSKTVVELKRSAVETSRLTLQVNTLNQLALHKFGIQLFAEYGIIQRPTLRHLVNYHLGLFLVRKFSKWFPQATLPVTTGAIDGVGEKGKPK